MVSENARELCNEVQKLISGRRRPRIERMFASLEHERRRSAAISRNRAKVIAQAAAAIGIDLPEIERWQRDDTATLVKFLDEQAAALQAEAAEMSQRRGRLIRDLRASGRRIEYRTGNPMELVCLWNANMANVDPLFLGGGSETSNVILGPQAGANSVESKLSAQQGVVRIDIDFHFPWLNPTAGWLSLTSWVYAWGSYRVLAPAACFFTNGASAELGASMAFFQRSPNGWIELGSTPFIPILDKQITSDSSFGRGEIGASGQPTGFSDYITLTKPEPVPILAASPIDVVVTIKLIASASND